MSDTTWGARIPEELKEKLTNTMQEAGLKGKDFIEDMFNLYTLHKTKQEAPVAFQSEIDELRQYTNRINTIYSNIIDRTQIALDMQDSKHSEKLHERNNMILDLQDKIETEKELSAIARERVAVLEDELKELKEECKQLDNKHLQYINNVNKTQESNEALIKEYRAKIDTLTEKIEEYKQYRSQIEKIKAELEEVKKERDNINNRMTLDKHEIEKLNSFIVETKEKHANEIQATKEKLNFECDKKILETEKNHQKQIKAMQEEYAEKVKSLLQEIGSQKSK